MILIFDSLNHCSSESKVKQSFKECEIKFKKPKVQQKIRIFGKGKK